MSIAPAPPGDGIVGGDDASMEQLMEDIEELQSTEIDTPQGTAPPLTRYK